MLLVDRWPVFLPVALTPLWQLKQLPVTPSWLNPVAGFQATVLWHMLHSDVVATCVAGLPVALTLLWQLEHEPCTCT